MTLKPVVNTGFRTNFVRNRVGTIEKGTYLIIVPIDKPSKLSTLTS